LSKFAHYYYDYYYTFDTIIITPSARGLVVYQEKSKINQLDEKEAALSRRLFDGGNDDETAAARARDPGVMPGWVGRRVAVVVSFVCCTEPEY
jgi:hypothetical protein